MNKKGEMGGGEVGLLILVAVAIILGASFLTPIAQYVGTATNTGQATNVSFTMPANGSTTDLTPCGQKNTSAVVIYNYTNDSDATLPANPAVRLTGNNATISQAQSSTTGYLHSQVTTFGNAVNYFGNAKVNVTCTFEPEGYITDSGGRAIASLVIVLFALGIAVIAIVPSLRSKIMDLVK